MSYSVKNSGVYCIRNTKTGKIYIGSSINCKVRLGRHKTDLLFNKHPNMYLQRAYNKYGKQNFVFELIESVKPTKHTLIEREQYWMDTLQSYKRRFGYNIIPKAYSTLGIKRKSVDWLIGNKFAEGHSPWNKGKLLSLEIRKKLSIVKLKSPTNYWTGKVRSEETKQKIKEKLLGRKLSKQHIENIKLGYCGNQYHKVG